MLEIIYISCDRNKEEFLEIIKDMPWACIEFKEQGIREIVTKHYDISGIPSLLLINEHGYLVSSTCVADIATNTESEAIQIWKNLLQNS